MPKVPKVLPKLQPLDRPPSPAIAPEDSTKQAEITLQHVPITDIVTASVNSIVTVTIQMSKAFETDLIQALKINKGFKSIYKNLYDQLNKT